MRPTDLKLSKTDKYLIKQLFMKMWDERASIGPDVWFEIIMLFLEKRGYRLEKEDDQ